IQRMARRTILHGLSLAITPTCEAITADVIQRLKKRCLTGFVRSRVFRLLCLPQFGIFGSGAVFCGMIGVWLATTIEFPPSVGISVHALPLGALTGSYDPWTQALLIRVDDQHRFYLNSNLISADKIPGELARSFRARANWTVYVQGDPNAAYGRGQGCGRSQSGARPCRASDALR